MNISSYLTENLEYNISKYHLKKTKQQKFLRINRYIYDILKKQHVEKVLVYPDNEYRVDYLQYQLNDMDYYWLILRLNFLKLDFLDLNPFIEYTLELSYKSIVNSIMPIV